VPIHEAIESSREEIRIREQTFCGRSRETSNSLSTGFQGDLEIDE
jgi:hypothetical protein